MRTFVKVSIGVALSAWALSACSQDASQRGSSAPEPESRNVSTQAAISEVMHAKVASASSLLVAVATSDYERVATDAEMLRDISQRSGFIAQDTVAYRTLAERFRDDVTKLAADARKHDQAAIEADYHRVTESCFHCHAHVRAEHYRSDMPGRSGM